MLQSVCVFSQTEKKLLRKGYDAYFSGQPLEATNYFSSSLKEKSMISIDELYSFKYNLFRDLGKGPIYFNNFRE